MKIDVIYPNDCMGPKGMKRLPNESIPLVVTDPPYNLGKDYGETYNDKRPEEEYWKDYKRWFSEIFRVARDPSRLYVSCIPRQMWKIRPLLEKIGWKYCQFIVWHSRNCFIAGKVSKKRINQPWTMTFEVILLFKKGKPPKMLNALSELTFDVMIISSPQRNFKDNKRYLSTQKPVKLIKTIIKRTPGDIVLDPFLGSGTTTIACKEAGRHYIGFEINPEHYEIAKTRTARAVFQKELFD